MTQVRWPVVQRGVPPQVTSQIVGPLTPTEAAPDLTWDRIVRAPAKRSEQARLQARIISVPEVAAVAEAPAPPILRVPAQRPSFTPRPKLGIVASLDAGAEFLPPPLLRSRLRQQPPFEWLTQSRTVTPEALDAGAENLPPIVYRPAAQEPSHTPRAQTIFVAPEEAVVEFPTPPVIRPQYQGPAFQARTQAVFAAVVEAAVEVPVPPVVRPLFQRPSFTPVARLVFFAVLEAPPVVRAVLQRPSYVGRPRLVLVPTPVAAAEFPTPRVLRPVVRLPGFQARTQTVVPPFVEVAPSVYVPVAFGRPSPSAGIIVGSPNGGIGSGSPNGGIGAGTPSAAMFGTPSPTHGD